MIWNNSERKRKGEDILNGVVVCSNCRGEIPINTIGTSDDIIKRIKRIEYCTNCGMCDFEYFLYSDHKLVSFDTDNRFEEKVNLTFHIDSASPFKVNAGMSSTDVTLSDYDIPTINQLIADLKKIKEELKKLGYSE